MDRRAVAATVVSIVIFSTMLLANSAIYTAENSVLKTTVVSSVQLREESLASFYVGVSSFQSLAAVQGRLQVSGMDCRAPQPYLDSLNGSRSSTAADGGIDLSSSSAWGYLSGGTTTGGDSLIPKFSGYSSGGLNVQVSTGVHEDFAGGLPSYSRNATEVFHLDIPVQSMIAECLSTLSAVAGALATVPFCTQQAVDAALSDAQAGYLPQAQVSASAALLGGRCSVTYSVTITRAGIAGVSGTFQWSVFGSGSVLTGGSPLSGPLAV